MAENGLVQTGDEVKAAPTVEQQRKIVALSLLKRDQIREQRAQVSGLFKEMSGNTANPDDLLRKNNETLGSLAKLLNDPIVSGAKESFVSGVLSNVWSIEQGKASEAVTEAVRNMIAPLANPATFADCLTAFDYGFSIQEINWGPGHLGAIVPRELVLRSVDHFTFSSLGVPLFKSADKPDGESMETMKYVLTQNEATSSNPYGKANLARVYWLVKIKTGIIRYQCESAELYGMPTPVVYYNTAQYPKDTDLTELGDIVAQWYGSNMFVVPQDKLTVELVTASPGSTEIYDKIIDRCNGEISIVYIGHAGSMFSTPGKLGNEDNATNVRADKIMKGVGFVEHVFNTLIRYFNIVNLGLPESELPKFALKPRKGVDLALVEQWARLKTSYGFTPNKEFIAESLGISSESFDIPEAASPNPIVGLAVTLLDTIKAYNLHQMRRDEAVSFAVEQLGYEEEKAQTFFGPENERPPAPAPASGGGGFTEGEFTEPPAAVTYAESLEEVPADQATDVADMLLAALNNIDNHSAIIDETVGPLLERIQGATTYKQIQTILNKSFPSLNTNLLYDKAVNAVLIPAALGNVNRTKED